MYIYKGGGPYFLIFYNWNGHPQKCSELVEIKPP